MATIQIAAVGDDASLYTDFASNPQYTPNTLRVGYQSFAVSESGVGLRFLNILIDQGSTVLTATLTVTAQRSLSNTTVNSQITAEDADDTIVFSDLASYQAKYATRTTAVVNWDNIPAFTVDAEYTSPDFSPVLEEIFARPGWVSGNSVTIFWEDHDGRSTAASNTYRRIYSYNESAAKSAKLNVTFTPPGGAPQMIIINMI